MARIGQVFSGPARVRVGQYKSVVPQAPPGQKSSGAAPLPSNNLPGARKSLPANAESQVRDSEPIEDTPLNELRHQLHYFLGINGRHRRRDVIFNRCLFAVTILGIFGLLFFMVFGH